MNKIETTIDKVQQDIGNFYKFDQHHFIVMNAIDLGEKVEVQWFFHDYSDASVETMFYMFCSPADVIPSVGKFIDSAWVAESELADLLGLNIENAKKGFVLEPDSKQAPLLKKKK
jgi:ech hydrogenase subunit D